VRERRGKGEKRGEGEEKEMGSFTQCPPLRGAGGCISNGFLNKTL